MQQNKGFGSKIGFILAAAGSAVGVGNLWGFPYRAGMSGGAAFVLVYILMVLAIGAIVMLSEMYIGKRAGKNVVDAYGMVSPKLKWVGGLNVVTPFLISSYYIVIGGWSLKYAFNYLTAQDFATNSYFSEYISQGFTPIIYMLIFVVISAIIVCAGVEKGIEKFSKIAMPMLLICLVLVVIRSLTLGEGVREGLEFFILKLDFEALGFSGILMAMSQAFFSLSLGLGAMIVYGSYSNSSMKLSTSIFTICALDTVVAILAGLAIFPAVFAFGFQPTEGTGLMFSVLPQVFASMPAGGLFGFMFFILVVFAALTSIVSLLEVVSQVSIEKLGWSRKKSTVVFSSLIAVIGVFVSLSMGAVPEIHVGNFDLLTYIDEAMNYVIIPLLALMACISIAYVVKPEELRDKLRSEGDEFKWFGIFRIFVKFITPVLIVIVLISGIIERLQTIANFHTIVIGALLIILAMLVMNYLSYKKDKKSNLK
ncbi:MAG: sodium-dependent transporter [Bacillota bacterium]